MLFNNGMRIGSTSPYPENVNYVRPGQIPLLNNSPVIVLRNGRLKLAMGTPGTNAHRTHSTRELAGRRRWGRRGVYYAIQSAL